MHIRLSYWSKHVSVMVVSGVRLWFQDVNIELERLYSIFHNRHANLSTIYVFVLGIFPASLWHGYLKQQCHQGEHIDGRYHGVECIIIVHNTIPSDNFSGWIYI